MYNFDSEKPISDFIMKLNWPVSNKFEIVGKSIKSKDKQKNGDFFDYTILENGIVVLTLADGVGSRNCDWLASKTACKEFIVNSCRFLNKDYSSDLLLKMCYDIDKKIFEPSDNCNGMLAVFAAVIWNTETNLIHYVNIGDTRIYKINNEGVFQISQDETKDVIMRDKQGKLITQNGTTVVRSGITNALGQGNARVIIEKSEFKFGETIVLASDGCYNCKSTFNSDIQNVNNSMDLEKSTEKLFSSYLDYQADDITILILRRNDIDSEIFKDYNNVDDVETIKHKLTKHTLTNFLHDDLKQNINKKNKEICIAILDKMITDFHLPTKEQLNELLAICEASDFKEVDIYDRIINLIRMVMK